MRSGRSRKLSVYFAPRLFRRLSEILGLLQIAVRTGIAGGCCCGSSSDDCELDAEPELDEPKTVRGTNAVDRAPSTFKILT